jgi:hypothetical protein
MDFNRILQASVSNILWLITKHTCHFYINSYLLGTEFSVALNNKTIEKILTLRSEVVTEYCDATTSTQRKQD